MKIITIIKTDDAQSLTIQKEYTEKEIEKMIRRGYIIQTFTVSDDFMA